VLALISILVANLQIVDSDRRLLTDIVDSFSDIERVPLWVFTGITKRALKDEFVELGKQWVDDIRKSDFLYDQAMHSIPLPEFVDLIPQEFVEYTANTLLVGNESHSLEEWADMISQVTPNFQVKATEYESLSRYLQYKFVCMYLVTLATFLMFIVMNWGVTEMAKAELDGAELILKALDLEDDGKMLSDIKVHRKDIPVIFAVVDRHSHVVRATRLASSRFGLTVGHSLEDSGFAMQVKTILGDTISTFNKDAFSPAATIDVDDSLELLVIPIYKSSSKAVISLEKALIFGKNKVEDVALRRQVEFLYHLFYPKPAGIGERLPARIASERRPFLFVFLRLEGLGDWAESSPLEAVDRFEKVLFERLTQHCKESGLFTTMKQTSNCFVFPMDCSKASSVSVWKLFELGGNHCTAVLRIVEEVQEDFGCRFPAYVLMFKCVEPDLYLSAEKMAAADFVGDAEFAGEEHVAWCVPGRIHLVSTRKEPNATKLKTGYTCNGQKFDLFVLV
jgi:hypothetical protein